MEKLSAVIITLNEEANIERCLKSLDWVDEILVVDSGSTDRTVEICEKYGTRVLKTEWLGFGRTKHFAVSQARNDWIFSIDADEEVTPRLRDAIRKLLSNPEPRVAYRIKRIPYYLGRRIRFSGWQNDYPLRLFNRQYGNFNFKDVHEAVQFNGSVRRLDAPLNHFTYPSVSSHIQKMDRYTTLSVQETVQKHRRITVPGAVLRACFRFFKMYVLKCGFLDGRVGFILCFNSAFGIYLKYIKVWEHNYRQKSSTSKR